MNYLQPHNENSGITSLSCITPVGYLTYKFTDKSLVKELELVNSLSKYMMPNILYLASKYSFRNKKESKRGMFTACSPFTEDVLLPLLEKFTTFEGEEFTLSKEALWSFVNKAGLSFLDSNTTIINKAVSMPKKMEFNEWSKFVNRVNDNISQTMPYAPFFIFPASLLVGDILSRSGATFRMTSDTSYRVSLLEYTSDLLAFDAERKYPSHIALSLDNDNILFSFIFDFSNSGGAKELYSFSNSFQQKYPNIMNYKYLGKSHPFYYPVIYTPPISHKLG